MSVATGHLYPQIVIIRRHCFRRMYTLFEVHQVKCQNTKVSSATKSTPAGRLHTMHAPRSSRRTWDHPDHPSNPRHPRAAMPASLIARSLALAAALGLSAACGTPGTLPCDHRLGEQAQSACPPTLWPCPAKFTSGSTNMTVDSASFKFTGTTHPDVVAGFARYMELTFPHPVPASDKAAAGAVSGCTVAVSNMTKLLQMETDESYTLDIKADGTCAITSVTYVGALRAVRCIQSPAAPPRDPLGGDLRLPLETGQQLTALTRVSLSFGTETWERRTLSNQWKA